MIEKFHEVKRVPRNELDLRMKRFVSIMDKAHPDWEMCAVSGILNMYYLTGTIQDGVVLIERGKSAVLWVRRSFERAGLESEFKDIRYMGSFRDIASAYKKIPETIYLDMAEATLQWYTLLNKQMNFKNVNSVDNVFLSARAVKTPYEIEILERAGAVVHRLLTKEIFNVFSEEMTEAELGAELLTMFIKNGYHGISRFAMRNAETLLGHIGFADSPIYPSVFNGASGVIGLCPAVPVLGSPDIKLKKGDLIYVDVVFGMEGYNTDKTLIYSFGQPQSDEVEEMHKHCLALEKQAVSLMKPGIKPSAVYEAVLQSVKPEFLKRFMGAPGRTVPFLGHGTGLYVDEWPVIANGFDDPLEVGMTIAIEPKIGIEGVGIVGCENTYLITEEGARCITGDSRELILC